MIQPTYSPSTRTDREFRLPPFASPRSGLQDRSRVGRLFDSDQRAKAQREQLQLRGRHFTVQQGIRAEVIALSWKNLAAILPSRPKSNPHGAVGHSRLDDCVIPEVYSCEVLTLGQL